MSIDPKKTGMETFRYLDDLAYRRTSLDRTCKLCGGKIGPDITERPMCYGCGPDEMKPRELRKGFLGD